jgi:LAO/AO transport system kinase
MSETARSPSDYCAGVLAGDRRSVAKTITLLESRRPEHAALGHEILERLVPRSGDATRVGITGSPGVGKSSFIETLGMRLLGQGHRVAVLAVDPTSPVSGGSILGDKTRMERLAREEGAFIRPSPSGGTLGGVAHRTREAMLVCEAAGYDVVLVETVGVGQSELEVASMVDFFCVLLQPGAGDELQGIKRGLLELADALVVNKWDGEQKGLAERTCGDYAQALHLLRPPSRSWTPRAITASALTGDGIEGFWEMVREHRDALSSSGDLEARRRDQALAWLWRLLDDGLQNAFRGHAEVAHRLPELERAVRSRETAPMKAARALLETFLGASPGTDPE